MMESRCPPHVTAGPDSRIRCRVKAGNSERSNNERGGEDARPSPGATTCGVRRPKSALPHSDRSARRPGLPVIKRGAATRGLGAWLFRNARRRRPARECVAAIRRCLRKPMRSAATAVNSSGPITSVVIAAIMMAAKWSRLVRRSSTRSVPDVPPGGARVHMALLAVTAPRAIPVGH
jgi:hypothetical protein